MAGLSIITTPDAMTEEDKEYFSETTALDMEVFE